MNEKKNRFFVSSSDAVAKLFLPFQAGPRRLKTYVCLLIIKPLLGNLMHIQVELNRLGLVAMNKWQKMENVSLIFLFNVMLLFCCIMKRHKKT